MDCLWTSEELIAATGGRPVGKMPEGLTGISIDTRTLEKGDAFFAIKGGNFDGHAFIGNAMRAEAGLAVVAEEKLVALGQYQLPFVVVDDVLAAMERLGQAARLRSKARIIAVTGSVGKTSVKEMLNTVLGECGSVHASIKSFNNHWGVPLTLARMPQNTRYGVFEIGMNHPDEIRPLVKMVQPHIAIITTVAAAHLGAFSGLDEIARAKAEIFEGIVDGGYALINRDNIKLGLLKRLAEKAGVENVLTFGQKRGADFSLRDMVENANGQAVTARLQGEASTFQLGMHGMHMAMNAVCAAGAAKLVGADMDTVLAAFEKVQPEKGRGETHNVEINGNRICVIDESYNANPASMAAAIDVLGKSVPLGKGRRIAVLGDMLELGASSPKLHADLKKVLEEANVDRVFLVGERMKSLEAAFVKQPGKVTRLVGHFDNIEEMQPVLLGSLNDGDVMMAKASNSLKFAGLVEALTAGKV